MTRQIPEGDSLAGLRNAADVLRHGFEVWPADADEKCIDDFLRRTRARPEWPRPRPWWTSALFLAAAFFAGAGLTMIIGDMVQTGAATVLEAERVSGW